MATIRHEILLFVALFGLRFTGQGLCSLIGATLIGRQFSLSRGRALSLGGLGYPLGEALLPALTLMAIEQWGWRTCMVGVSAVGAVLLPGILWSWLPKERPHAQWKNRLAKSKNKPDGEADSNADSDSDRDRLKDESLQRPMPVFEWLKDSRFLFLIPALLIMPAAMTGILVHQARIAEARDWPLTLMASSLALFALARIVSSLAAGPVVDKVGACRLVPLILVPLSIGMLLMAGGDQPSIVRWFFAFAGLSQGMSSNIMTAAWAEIYGPEILGAVKGRVTMLAIVGSAMGPVGLGWALDQGISVGANLVGMTVLSGFASALAYGVVRNVHRNRANSLHTGSDPAT